MTNPPPLTSIEANMFGADAERCPKTGRPFEQGSGALPKDQQTANFLGEAEQEAARQALAAKSARDLPSTDNLVSLVVRADRGEQRLN